LSVEVRAYLVGPKTNSPLIPHVARFNQNHGTANPPDRFEFRAARGA